MRAEGLQEILSYLTVPELKMWLVGPLGPAYGNEEDERRVKGLKRDELERLVLRELLATTPDWVPAALEAGAPDRFSVSYLKTAEECLFRSFAERVVDTNGRLADFGSAFHEVAAAAATRCQLQGKESLETAESLAIARRVLGNPEDPAPLPYADHGALLELVERWGYGFTFPLDADEVRIEWGVHTELEVDGIPETFSARLDLTTVRGAYAEVEDYKAGPAMPSDEEVEERLPLPLYAWHTFAHFPEVQEVTAWESYVRHGFRRPREPMVFTRDIIPGIEDYLATISRRVRRMYAEVEPDRLPPANDGAWCSHCPVKRDCPLPKVARPAAVESEEEALQELSGHVVGLATEDERREALRAYMDAHELETLGVEEPGKKRLVVKPKSSKRFNKKRAGELHGFSPEDPELLDISEGTELRLEKVKAAK